MVDRIIVAFTGATGQEFGVKALEILDSLEDVQTHLVISRAAEMNLEEEGNRSLTEVKALAEEVHAISNVGASIASGSFPTSGMIVAPCSMKTLSNIANGNADNLITRAADVMLKERQNLVLMPMEKPLNRIHLENMLAVTDAGGIIYPPQLSFYTDAGTIDSMIRQTMRRALGTVGLEIESEQWEGLGARSA
ncbi:MAG: UbiX family flavin prenyltransferase [Halanaeroarchaeum sp.]